MKRDKLLFIGFQLFGNLNFLNKIVQFMYVYLLVPVIRFFLMKKHSNLVDLKIRNSVADKQAFNLFFSDIDSTLIVFENTDTKNIVKDFSIFRNFFIMLDFPEIYTEAEYASLEELKKKDSWEVVDLCWNLRKINWCKNKQSHSSSEFEHMKMQRSISKSFDKVLKVKSEAHKSRYFLSDFKYLDKLFEVSPKNIFGCFYSSFLGNDNLHGIVIEISRLQYLYFNSLLPGEAVDTSIKETLNPFFMECKLALLTQERLITMSSIRLKEALGLDVNPHREWLRSLDLDSQGKN